MPIKWTNSDEQCLKDGQTMQKRIVCRVGWTMPKIPKDPLVSPSVWGFAWRILPPLVQRPFLILVTSGFRFISWRVLLQLFCSSTDNYPSWIHDMDMMQIMILMYIDVFLSTAICLCTLYIVRSFKSSQGQITDPQADRLTLFELLQMLALKDAHKEDRRCTILR